MSRKIVAAITGGGSGFIGNYLQKGGKSSEFLEAIVPYGQSALVDFLGITPDKFCSHETASQMSSVARERALKLAPETPFEDAVGIGVTASLHKEGERPDRLNHAYISLVKGNTHVICGGTLDKDEWAYRVNKEKPLRQFQEEYLSECIESVLAGSITWSGFTNIDHKWYILNKELYNVYTGQAKSCLVSENTFVNNSGFSYDIIVPGSFNPLHDGHLGILRYLQKYRYSSRIYLDLSIKNFEKPPIDYCSLSSRIGQIEAATAGLIDGIVVTSAATFEEKLKIYRWPTFAIGVDTFNRIPNPDSFKNPFLVFPRNGEKPQESVNLRFVERHTEINVSSSDIRKNNADN